MFVWTNGLHACPIQRAEGHMVSLGYIISIELYTKVCTLEYGKLYNVGLILHSPLHRYCQFSILCSGCNFLCAWHLSKKSTDMQAEQWVNNMTKAAEDEPTEVESEARPKRLVQPSLLSVIAIIVTL